MSTSSKGENFGGLFDCEGTAIVGSPLSGSGSVGTLFGHDEGIMVIGSPQSDNSYGQFENDDSVLTMDNDLPCPCNGPTLQTLETLVGQWQKDWGSESTTWNEVFDTELACSRAEGEEALAGFIDQAAQQALEGRALMDGIRDVAHTHCPCCRERLKYDTMLLHDLLVSVVSEVKFFEVKLDTVCN